MKTAPEVAREVLYRISDGRMADDCGGKVGCPYCKPYIDAIADAIAAAEARGRDAALEQAAHLVATYYKKTTFDDMTAAIRALAATPSGAGGGK